MEEPRKIAALIITYNPNEGELKQNIDAVMEQVNVIVVVDNGSSNFASKLLDSERIHFIKNQNNEGIAKALNIGMEYLQGARFSVGSHTGLRFYMYR